jgi:hypothetical protein
VPSAVQEAASVDSVGAEDPPGGTGTEPDEVYASVDARFLVRCAWSTGRVVLDGARDARSRA